MVQLVDRPGLYRRLYHIVLSLSHDQHKGSLNTQESIQRTQVVQVLSKTAASQPSVSSSSTPYAQIHQRTQRSQAAILRYWRICAHFYDAKSHRMGPWFYCPSNSCGLRYLFSAFEVVFISRSSRLLHVHAIFLGHVGSHSLDRSCDA